MIRRLPRIFQMNFTLFSMCFSHILGWGGNVSQFFILFVGEIKDQNKKFEKFFCCLKDKSTSSFKLKKNIYLDIYTYLGIEMLRFLPNLEITCDKCFFPLSISCLPAAPPDTGQRSGSSPISLIVHPGTQKYATVSWVIGTCWEEKDVKGVEMQH